MNGTNETVSDYLIPYYLDPINLILKIVGLSSSFIGLIGNVAVLTLIFGSNKFRRPANVFVANLSFTSLVYILVTNLKFYAGRPQDPLHEYLPICLLSAFMGKFTHALIAFTSMVIVIDRNYRVKNPMMTPSRTGPSKIILLIWITSIIITFPRIYMYHLKIFNNQMGDGSSSISKKCIKIILWDMPSVQVAYLLIYFAFVTILPISTAIIGLVQISRVINVLSSCNQTSSLSNIRYRILRNTFIFSVLFIIGWGPSGAIMCLTDVPAEFMPHWISNNFKFFKYFNIIGFVQNSLNPILLFVLSSDLRHYIFRTKQRLCHI